MLPKGRWGYVDQREATNAIIQKGRERKGILQFSSASTNVLATVASNKLNK